MTQAVGVPSPAPPAHAPTTQSWLWSFALSLVACAVLAGLHFHQRALLDRTLEQDATLRQARIDLSRGFLHAIAGDDASPFGRDQGIALLDQSLVALEESSAALGLADEAARSLPAAVSSLRAHVERWVASPDDDRQATAALRIAFHEVEQAAARIDTESRDKLASLSRQLNRDFIAALGVEAVLLVGLFVVLALGTRQRRAADLERARVMAALHESERRLSLVTTQAPAYIWATDRHLTVTYLSLPPGRAERWVGKPLSELFANTSAGYAEHIDALAGRSLAFQAERSGRSYESRLEPLRGIDGEIIGCVGVAFDITERKEAEERFRRIFQVSPVGHVLVRCRDRQVVEVNDAWLACTGYAHDASVNTTTDGWGLLGSAGADDLAERARAQVGKPATESPFVRRDGTTGLALVTVDALTIATDEHWLFAVSDITARRDLEEQVRRSQKLDAIGTLAGGIAHDFNNILTAIGGHIDLALLHRPLEAPVHAHLEAVAQATLRATELVRQILTFSRQQEQRRQSIDLGPVVLESLRLLRASIPTTIEFDVRIDEGTPHVLADATQIHQVLMNLGTNAWHAMRIGVGRLEVRLSGCFVDAALSARLPRLRPGRHVRLSVADTGTGMSAATLERIFEPFFTTKAPGEGTGLGLAVVHGVVEAHDGAVTVTSREGEGTRVDIYFPADVKGRRARPPASDSLPMGAGERVLFVDDEAVLTRLAEQILSRLGYVPAVYTRPLDALARFRDDPAAFDLVITDHTMPALTGLELCRAMLGVRPDLPVILSTGYAAVLDADEVRRAGVVEVLAKPPTLKEFAHAVRRVLDVRSPTEP